MLQPIEHQIDGMSQALRRHARGLQIQAHALGQRESICMIEKTYTDQQILDVDAGMKDSERPPP
ncbi:MAG: hypothetical protein BGO12_00095 [Verrucomicrobia bacterium 61-8]|nr:MAG: hypothetical protein BGO12_00095 [Verrucomicrobia bacterium 61-8]